MAVELDHSFTTTRSIDDSFAAILDLERVIPCVEGGSVIERTGPDSVKAEIKVKMGAMSMTFTGTVEIAEQDAAAHRAVLSVKSREAGGQGHANAHDRRSSSHDGGGTIHTNAQITGKAASMGEGVVAGVLDALIARLHREARGALSGRWRRSRCDTIRAGRGAARRRDGHPGGRRPPGVPRQRPRRLRLRRVRQRARRGDGRRLHDEEGARALRALPTVNVAVNDDRRSARPLTASVRTREREQRGPVARVGGRAVAVDGRDADERRVAHRGRREVAQRVVVGPLPRHAAEAEALGRQAAREPVGRRARASRQSSSCSRDVEAERAAGG